MFSLHFRDVEEALQASGSFDPARARIVEPEAGLADFTVALHWSHRFHNDPANRWLRELAIGLFCELEAPTSRTSSRRRARPAPTGS